MASQPQSENEARGVFVKMVLAAKKTGAMILVALFACSLPTLAQQPDYPKEIRGYKVALREVDEKKAGTKATDEELDSEPLIRFGDPQNAGITPLGISFELPMVVKQVKRKGRVDFMVFEKMLVNNTSVEIDEYLHGFDLPNKTPLTLTEPLKFFVSLPSAVLGAIDEWNDSKKTWLITGRVYVFGKYKKSLFTFKRCIPIEINITIPNPVR
jgi:hypothetical protein